MLLCRDKSVQSKNRIEDMPRNAEKPSKIKRFVDLFTKKIDNLLVEVRILGKKSENLFIM